MRNQRYKVVRKLEAGGMAEVFVGEAQSVQGFRKKVAIKRVLPHLAQNDNFIGMFLDEARLGARLDHANIVSVFDIGASDDTYFIVMEFVEGCNLGKVIEHLRNRGRPFPVKEALYLTMEACHGLSYAHELTDDAKTPLNIVHRDISPPNILVSVRGEVKVTDFGLAKATTQLESTDPGVVKGKFSYLSPEAALGETVDARADIFSLGIILWEMLAGRKLFMGESDIATVRLVQKADIPNLRELNPNVDSKLNDLVLKALARDRNQRYQSARAFVDDIAGYLFGRQMKVTRNDIATLITSIAEESANPSGSQQSIIDQLIQEELLRFTSIEQNGGEEVPTGRVSLSEDDHFGLQDVGQQNPNAEGYENLNSWFSDDDVEGDLGLPQEQDSVSISADDAPLNEREDSVPILLERRSVPPARSNTRKGNKAMVAVFLFSLLTLGAVAAYFLFGRS